MTKPTPEEKRQSAVELAVVLLRDRTRNSEILQADYEQLLSTMLWKWTEADGKYRGCRYWTRAAMETPRESRAWRHEHVVPRKLLVRALCNLPSPGAQDVRELLELMGIACIVTKDEHDLLPDLSWEDLLADPWGRYKSVGLEVVDTASSISR